MSWVLLPGRPPILTEEEKNPERRETRIDLAGALVHPTHLPLLRVCSGKEVPPNPGGAVPQYPRRSVSTKCSF